LVIVAALGRVGPWLPAVGPDVQGLREKDHFLAARMAADQHDDLGDRDT
jgi:hypothetical protein